MDSIQSQPVGANAPVASDSQPVITVYSGDTWRVRTRITWENGAGATPDNSRLTVVLVNQRFDPADDRLWSGNWDEGVTQVSPAHHPGLVDITLPHSVTDTLRRGQYMLGIRLESLVPPYRSCTVRPEIHFLLEYTAVGTTHSVPYKD